MDFKILSLKDVPDADEEDVDVMDQLINLPKGFDCYGFIYSIVNTITKEEYIGQTIRDWQIRFDEHFNGRSGAKALCEAIKEHGQQHFTKAIVEIVTAKSMERLFQKLDERETHLIEVQDTYNNGYNMNRGPGSFTSNKDIQFYQMLIDKRRTFPCDKCSWKCVSEDSLRTHKYDKHGGEKPFQCDQCDCATIDKHVLALHVKVSHDGIKDFKCSICEYETGYIGNLKNHVKRHMNEREYECQLCAQGSLNKFNTKSDLMRHINFVHSEARPYLCSVQDCIWKNIGFKTSNHLKRHIYGVHERIRTYKCRYTDCDFKCHHKDELDLHRIETHLKICDDCGYSTMLKAHFEVHKRSHSGERPFKCDWKYPNGTQCKHASTTRGALNLHMSSHNNKKQYVCDICNLGFNTSGNLNSHKRDSHSDNKPFKCDKIAKDGKPCSSSFKRKEKLQNHIRGVHLNEKPYGCIKCEKSYRKLETLKSHSKRHHIQDLKEYNYTNSKKQKIQKQIKPKKPGFNCSRRLKNNRICGKSYSTKDHLGRHLDEQHDCIERYLCLKCAERFYRMRRLSKHYDINHEIKVFDYIYVHRINGNILKNKK